MTESAELKQKVFKQNWEFQLNLEEQVKEILKQHFNLNLDIDTIEVSDKETDMIKGIDITITTYIPCETKFEIGVRIRKLNQFEKYGVEFTVRYPSEMSKICKRYLQYELYCFADDNNILSYRLVNLSTFLDAINQNTKLITDNIAIQNSDGNNTSFYAFKFSDFPKHMVLGEWTNLHEIQKIITNQNKRNKLKMLETYKKLHAS